MASRNFDEDDIIEEDDDEMSMLLESVQIKDVAGSSVGMAGTAQLSTTLSANPPIAPQHTQQIQQQMRRNVTPAELRTWTILYPCYFDPKLKIKQGRRLPIKKCTGCEGTSIYDVVEACAKLELMCAYLNKRHPAGNFMNPGRVHVELYSPIGSPATIAASASSIGTSVKGSDGLEVSIRRPAIKSHINSKLKLMEAIAKEIPSLPGRAMRHAQAIKARQDHEERVARARGRVKKLTSGTSAIGSSGSGGGGGGGGEKERDKKEKGKR